MAISQPQANDFLSSPDHSALHRIIAADLGAGVKALIVDASGNVGIGTTTFGANAVTVLGIANGTVPVAHVDNTIQIYSVDSSDATATLGLMLEQAVEEIGTFTATHKIKIGINGSFYWLTLDAV